MTALFFVIGLILLIGGAELLVRGSSRLAASVGITPLVIGLTVVAFGTSSPEFAVSIKAAFSSQPGVALGNIIGSNIFNTLFILGLSALITPLVVDQKLIRLEVPLMIMVSILVWVLGMNNVLGQVEGLFLFAGLLGYTGFLIIQSKQESEVVKQEYAQEYERRASDEKAGWINPIVMALVGLGMLVWGSNWLVDSAVEIARSFGVSDVIIGLTIIAAGTSMPEVVTSVVASLKGERDIAVGNIIGSNLFNLLGVLGLFGIVSPAGVAVSAEVLNFDLPVMILVTLVCVPIFFTGSRVGRWEGGLLLGYYVAYTVYLVLTATEHASLPYFEVVMYYGAIPLTLIILAVSALGSLRQKLL